MMQFYKKFGVQLLQLKIIIKLIDIYNYISILFKVKIIKFLI